MEEKKVENIFNNFLEKETIFQDKSVLQANYYPKEIKHRDKQIEQIARILAPVLKLDKPSNLFLYGKTGTGKTMSVLHTINIIKDMSDKKNLPIKVLYLNCKLKKIADTEYRIIAQLNREMGKEIPSTGLPTDEVYKIFFNCLDREKKIVILVLDEIDQLVKKTGDEILYNFTRINSELKNSQIVLVGISNDLVFMDVLDPRVKSSLSEEELIFPPYNALQIQDILNQRAKQAFKENSVGEGVIEKCSAYAAREHGDARRALELLRVAAELAEREGKEKVTLTELDDAEAKIEKDRILEAISTQPKQFQLILYSIISLASCKKERIFTGEIYELYQKFCLKTNLRPLTQRRISDVLSELDMLGIITAKVISKGRYGRTREVALSLHENLKQKARKIIESSLNL